MADKRWQFAVLATSPNWFKSDSNASGLQKDAVKYLKSWLAVFVADGEQVYSSVDDEGRVVVAGEFIICFTHYLHFFLCGA